MVSLLQARMDCAALMQHVGASVPISGPPMVLADHATPAMSQGLLLQGPPQQRLQPVRSC